PDPGATVLRWAVLPGSCQGRAEFRRNVWCAVRGFRAAEFRDTRAGSAADRYADGGRGEAAVRRSLLGVPWRPVRSTAATGAGGPPRRDDDAIFRPSWP